jgi:outer membrane protein OmpA-like peptidoglycan-associated protein
MTRRTLKTTTASLLALSLIQPYPAMAQLRALTPQVTQHSSADAGRERLFLAQAEAEAETTSCFTEGAVDTERCDIEMLRAELEALLANGLPDAADRPAEDELTAALTAEERIGLLTAAIETAEREASAEGTGTVAGDADATAVDPAVQADAAAEAEAAARAAAEVAGQAQAAAEETAQAEADAAAAAEAEADNATAADQEAAATAQADEAAAAAAAAEADAAAEAARVAQAEAEAEAAADAEAAATAQMEEQTESAVDDAAQAVTEAADETATEAERAAQEAEAAAQAATQRAQDEATEADPDATVAETAADATAEAAAGTETDTTAEAAPATEPEPVATAEEEAEASAMKDAEIVEEQEAAQGLGAVAAAIQDAAGESGTDTTTDSPTIDTTATADARASADVTTEVVTEADTRSSDEEFAATAQGSEARSSSGGLSNLEKAGLLALGAVAVGAIIQNGQRVAATSGDRVIVEDNAGRFQVLKDDDALLRQPGATVETRRFDDGSTITLTTRDDGSRVRTIRDASGRVLRRSVIGTDGQETVLINDINRVEPVNVSTLPPAPAQRLTFREARTTDELRAALREAELRDLNRTFSLRQVREIVEVRELAPQISIEDVTFRTGSAAIERSEAEQLRDIGLFMREMIRENPREVFLIEGYTDAVGSAASNLLLSDRRAESVALALSEYFDVPPENMVVQGYGERFLKIPTLESERQNRRVAVRRITNLIASR